MVINGIYIGAETEVIRWRIQVSGKFRFRTIVFRVDKMKCFEISK